jgi:hypothetical protein
MRREKEGEEADGAMRVWRKIHDRKELSGAQLKRWPYMVQELNVC